MNLFLILYLSILPYSCLLLETNRILDPDDIRSHFVFPMERKMVPSSRIIGGEEVTPHAYPFLAALFMYTPNTVGFCGGTLISPNWVLTAAHCLYKKPDYTLVLLGTHDVSVNETSRLVLKSTTYVVHEGWNDTNLQNDIALLKLPRNVTLGQYINVVTYAGGSQSYDELTGTIVGWGRTEYSGEDISTVLRKVNSRILSNNECKTIDPYQEIVVSSHICLDGNGPVGSCNGDSGGPLLIDNLQVGIVSFGDTNCTSGKPSVFTRVVDFQEWIATHAINEGGKNISSLAILSVLVLVLLLCNY